VSGGTARVRVHRNALRRVEWEQMGIHREIARTSSLAGGG